MQPTFPALQLIFVYLITLAEHGTEMMRVVGLSRVTYRFMEITGHARFSLYPHDLPPFYYRNLAPNATLHKCFAPTLPEPRRYLPHPTTTTTLHLRVTATFRVISLGAKPRLPHSDIGERTTKAVRVPSGFPQSPDKLPITTCSQITSCAVLIYCSPQCHGEGADNRSRNYPSLSISYYSEDHARFQRNHVVKAFESSVHQPSPNLRPHTSDTYLAFLPNPYRSRDRRCIS